MHLRPISITDFFIHKEEMYMKFANRADNFILYNLSYKRKINC